MSQASTTSSGVGARYATALFDLALEQNSLDVVAGDLARIEALIEGSEDLRRLIRSPVFGAEEQEQAISAILSRARISGAAANLVRLAARNRRLNAVPSMIQAYRALLVAHRGETTAEVTTAEPLSAPNAAALREALNAMTGKDVIVEAKVDPSLIGGLVVKIGSRQIDTSLKTKLNAMKIALKEVR